MRSERVDESTPVIRQWRSRKLSQSRRLRSNSISFLQQLPLRRSLQRHSFLVGRLFMTRSKSNPWLHRFSLLLAMAVLGLLCLGGLVTSHEAGMAVPDWPNTFGYNMFFFPFSKWVGGIFYEHSHRILASAVGFLTIILAVWLGLIFALPTMRQVMRLLLGKIGAWHLPTAIIGTSPMAQEVVPVLGKQLALGLKVQWVVPETAEKHLSTAFAGFKCFRIRIAFPCFKDEDLAVLNIDRADIDLLS